MTETLGLALLKALEQRKAKNQQIGRHQIKILELQMSLNEFIFFFDISNFPFFPRIFYLQPLDSLGTPVDVFRDQT